MTAPTPAWHVDEALLRSWINGVTGPVHAASVEQHVARCSPCRGRVAEAMAVDAPITVPDLELVWAGVRDEIELPPPSRVQRGLRRIGLSESDTLLLAAAPAMRTAWFNAVALVLAFVLVAGTYGDSRSVLLFLLCAPLVPMLGVTLSYGADAGVALEQEAATPYSPLRLVLLRTAAVLATSIPLVLLGGLLRPSELAVVWLVPALGFTALLLAASTWADPASVAVVLGTMWAMAVVTAALNGTVAAVYHPAALLLYTVAGFLAVLVLAHRLRRIGSLGGLL